MKSARKHAVLYKIVLLCLCTLVVVGSKARAGYVSAFGYGEDGGADGFAELPFITHGLVGEHEVGFGFMTEGFMGEYSCRFGGQHHGIPARLHGNRAAEEERMLLDCGAYSIVKTAKLVKARSALAPMPRKLPVVLRHAECERNAAGLVVIAYIRAEA